MMSLRAAPKMAVWLAVLSVVTCALIIGLAIAFAGIGAQAKQGQQARARQCLLAPVAVKVYKAQFEQGVITRADLSLLEGGLPAKCLK